MVGGTVRDSLLILHSPSLLQTVYMRSERLAFKGILSEERLDAHRLGLCQVYGCSGPRLHGGKAESKNIS